MSGKGSNGTVTASPRTYFEYILIAFTTDDTMTYNTVFAQGCPSPSKAHFNKDKYEALQSNEALPKLPI